MTQLRQDSAGQADIEKAKACMCIDAGPDWIANVAAALKAEREAVMAILAQENIEHDPDDLYTGRAERIAAIRARGEP